MVAWQHALMTDKKQHSCYTQHPSTTPNTKYVIHWIRSVHCSKHNKHMDCFAGAEDKKPTRTTTNTKHVKRRN